MHDLCCLFLLSLIYSQIISSPVLQVFCSIEFIRLKITFEYNYFGIIYTLPNRETCNIIGSGDTELAFYVPLKEPGRVQCGVITRNKIHSVALAIRHHHVVETSKDYTFLVQCPDTVLVQNSVVEETNVALNLFEDNQVVNNAVVGHRYSLEVAMPKPNYEISSCTALDGGADLRYHNLLDDRGCPLDDSILSPFRKGMKKLTFFADFTMFRFNGSHEFNIQCSIIKCHNRCVDRNCVRNVQMSDNLLHDAADQISQNFKSASTLATTRLIVRDHIKTNEVKKYIGCHYSEQPELIGLSFLLALLVTFTIALTVTGFHNRPFRCDWHPRDMPIMEDIAKLDETNRQQLTPKQYFARSTESSSGSKNFCEKNRETTIVKEIIHTTIATPENPAHSRMTSPLSSKSSRSTSTSIKNSARLVHRDSTLKSSSRMSPMRKIQIRRHAKLPRNKSFVSAIIEKKVNDVDQNMELNSEDSGHICSAHSTVSQTRSNASVNEKGNFYETPSNKLKVQKLSMKNSQIEQTCRNNSPVYINVDSSSQSLICPIEVARKKRLKCKKSDSANDLKKWRI